MAQRRIREIRPIDELRTFANPVRTGYTSRDVPSTAPIMALANALSDIQPSLTRFAAKQQEQQREDDTAKGVSLYELEGNRRSWADYIKEHPEHAAANPWIKEGFLRARMANEAETFRVWLQAQATGSEAAVEAENGQRIGLAEASPDQIAQWMQAQRRKYIQENMGGVADPLLLSEIWLPSAIAAERELQSRIIGYQQDVIWNRNLGEHMALIGNTLSRALEEGLFDGTSTQENTSAIGSQISEMARQLMLDNVPPQEVNKAIVSALINAAEDQPDTNADAILDVVNHIETTKGSFLGNLPGVRQEIEQARDNIRQENYWKIMQAERLKEMELDERRSATEKDLALAFFDNPMKIPKNVRAAYVKEYGLQSYTRFLSNLNAIADFDTAERGSSGEGPAYDARVVSLWARIATGEPPTIQEIMQSGLKKTDAITLIKTVSSQSEDDMKASKTYGPLISAAVRRKLYATDKDDDLLPEQALFADEISMHAGVEMKKAIAADPTLLQDPLRLRVEATRVAMEAANTYRNEEPDYIRRATTDSRVTLQPQQQGVNLLNGLDEIARKSVLEMAEEYVSAKAEGEDGNATGFPEFVAAYSKRIGIALTPEQALDLMKNKKEGAE